MHPNTFLKTFWRLEVRPQVFVAMSFAPDYQSRFDNVFAPAIEALSKNGVNLKPVRVDLSKTGDSILTDINDGIAHSALVLADVSTIHKDNKTSVAFRNANVLYEVGVALASRQPSEVLLVRDDRDKILFDVSTIPHATINFDDVPAARKRLVELMQARLKQSDYLFDARVQLALSKLSKAEISVIQGVGSKTTNDGWGHGDELVSIECLNGIPRLIAEGLVVLDGEFEDGTACYRFTELGVIVSTRVLSKPKFQLQKRETGQSAN